MGRAHVYSRATKGWIWLLQAQKQVVLPTSFCDLAQIIL